MCNVGEEGDDLALRIIDRADGAEAWPRRGRIDESGARVEASSGAVASALTGYDPIEEIIRHDITEFHSVSALARSRLAVAAAVVVTNAAVAVFATALVRLAAAVLGGNLFCGGQKKDGESEEIFHFWELL